MPPGIRPKEPRWNLDIDQYINPFIVPLPIRSTPLLVRRFLGYHDGPSALRPLGNVLVVTWAFLGTLGALSLIFVVCRAAFEDRGGPLILGSFVSYTPPKPLKTRGPRALMSCDQGAAAVLEFYAVDSPLSQPRNMILGQLISSIIGVGINRGFTQVSSSSSPQRYAELRWLAGALSCACSTVAMGLTGTVHPPAGATALLAVTDDSVARLGWMLVPLVLLSGTLMLVVALLINNVQRAFPVYWWTAEDEVGSFWGPRRGLARDVARRRRRRDNINGSVVNCPEKGEKVTTAREQKTGSVDEEDAAAGSSWRDQDFLAVAVTKRGICVPPDVHLRREERMCLEELRRRL